MFQVITPFRRLILCAENRKEMEDWISSLKSVQSREHYEVSFRLQCTVSVFRDVIPNRSLSTKQEDNFASCIREGAICQFVWGQSSNIFLATNWEWFNLFSSFLKLSWFNKGTAWLCNWIGNETLLIERTDGRLGLRGKCYSSVMIPVSFLPGADFKIQVIWNIGNAINLINQSAPHILQLQSGSFGEFSQYLKCVKTNLGSKYWNIWINLTLTDIKDRWIELDTDRP